MPGPARLRYFLTAVHGLDARHGQIAVNLRLARFVLLAGVARYRVVARWHGTSVERADA